MLTTREWASLILIGISIAGLLIWPKTRSAVISGFPDVVRSIHWKVVVSLASLLIWIVGCLALGRLLKLWDWDLQKDAVIITLTFAIPMMFRIPKAQTGRAIVRRLVRDSVGLVAILEFYLNVEPFPLWAELLLQALAALLAMLNAVAGGKAEWEATRRFTSGFLGLLGLGAIVWTTIAVIVNWGSLEWPELLRSFLMTLWFPALLLPFFYIEAYLMTTEVILVRLSFLPSGRRPVRGRVRLGVIVGLHLSVKLAARFDGGYNRVADERHFFKTLRFMRRFRREVRQADAAERTRIESLQANAGRMGTDLAGAQLDRREFFATKNRLDWISTCEMGRYEGNGNRYWSDTDGFTDLMVDAARFGLPEEHGFHVEVSADGQQWRAWRVVPSGWVLGMGGAGWRSEWVFSAAESPSSWPGGPGWTDRMTSPDLSPDWERNDDPVVRSPNVL